DHDYGLGTTVLTRVFTNRSKLDPRFSIDPKIIVENHHPSQHTTSSSSPSQHTTSSSSPSPSNDLNYLNPDEIFF
ncbi:unnamed protein product, partial [Adineta steineri]